jgi:hypothetical protein
VISVLPESFDDLLKCLTILVFGALVSGFVGRLLRLKVQTTLSLYVWHTLFALAYVALAANNGGDAVGYFRNSFDSFMVFDLGTNAVVYIVNIFSIGLNFSFLCTSLVFNIVGAIGLLFFLAALRDAKQGMHWSFWLMVFLPSVSLWSAGIGKDAVSFFASSLFAWWMIAGSKRIWPMIVSIVAMGVVRPHIAIVLAAAAAMFSIASARQSPIRAIGATVLVTVGSFFLLPIVMQKMKLGSLGLEEIGDVIGSRESNNMMGGSSIDISDMPIYLKIFTYLFRPLPFDAKSALQFLNSFENMVLLVMVLVGLGFYFLAGRQGKGMRLFPLMLMSFALVFFLSQITANLGIAVRQKWMALVPLLVVLASSLRVVSPLTLDARSRLSTSPDELRVKYRPLRPFDQ